jgi:hypothetical protein
MSTNGRGRTGESPSSSAACGVDGGAAIAEYARPEVNRDEGALRCYALVQAADHLAAVEVIYVMTALGAWKCSLRGRDNLSWPHGEGRRG